MKEAVKNLSHIILTIQATGDKKWAKELLNTYGVLSPELQNVLENLKNVEVPVDVAVSFTLEENLKSVLQ